jgi:hypothetical protein
VSGVTIKGSEYLLSQYVDESTLNLGDDKNSLKQAFNIFDCFSVCAGLRVNLDKTEDPFLVRTILINDHYLLQHWKYLCKKI